MSASNISALLFEPGIGWAGTFVKRATCNGRPLCFRLSPQLVANCLAPVLGAVGPIQSVAAHEHAIEAACRKALSRLDRGCSAVELRPDDFKEAVAKAA